MLLARRPVEPDAAAIAACELEREVLNEVREAPKPQKPQPTILTLPRSNRRAWQSVLYEASGTLDVRRNKVPEHRTEP